MDGQCFALLIDADNVSAKVYKADFNRAFKILELLRIREFMGIGQYQHSSWKDELFKNSMTDLAVLLYAG